MKSWRIELKPSAEKQYLKLDRKTRQRIKDALRDLEEEANPLLHPRVRPLTGKLKRQGPVIDVQVKARTKLLINPLRRLDDFSHRVS